MSISNYIDVIASFVPVSNVHFVSLIGRELRKRVSAKDSSSEHLPSISSPIPPRKARACGMWVMAVCAGIVVLAMALALAYFRHDFQLVKPQDTSQNNHHNLQVLECEQR